MIAESTTLFDEKCDLAVLVKGLNCFIIDELNNWRCRLLVSVLLGRVIEDTLLTVTKLKFRLLVRLNLCFSVGWYEVHVSLLLVCLTVLRHIDFQSFHHFHSHAGLVPVLITAVFLRVLNS